jgi:biopolymer transport protein ExbB/TolQ
MLFHADPMVQGVMVILFVVSLVSWIIIVEKIILVRRISRDIYLFKKFAAKPTETKPKFSDFPSFTRKVVEAGMIESRDDAGGESRADYRERIERSMREILAGELDMVRSRITFLATAGSVSPFIGLFGTVWGVMHSFVGIAATGETSLAVVAPGIAEALLATAMGLVAAIPAVVAYNKITSAFKKITKEALIGIGLTGNHLARIHFSRPES